MAQQTSHTAVHHRPLVVALTGVVVLAGISGCRGRLASPLAQRSSGEHSLGTERVSLSIASDSPSADPDRSSVDFDRSTLAPGVAITPVGNTNAALLASPIDAVDTGREGTVSPAQFAEWVEPYAVPVTSATQGAEIGAVEAVDDLESAVRTALAVHPELARLRAVARESWSRVPQVTSLPDPTALGTVYGEPMRMAEGEARGRFMISQAIPSLKRLDAQGQQATFEALMNQQAALAAEQRITADIREAWYRLYLLGELLRINDSNERLIESLLTTATAQVEVGRATSGDVILATLEQSRIEEERLRLRQQVASRTAVLNRLLNRPADTTVTLPDSLDQPESSDTVDPSTSHRQIAADLSLDRLRAIAGQNQPEIALAELRTQATAWGIRVAKLQRIPDLMLSYEHMLMRMNPGASGSDPWQLGAGITLPIWNAKYDAIRRQAAERHLAAHAGTEEVIRANEALLLDLIEQATAAERTATLYRETILPQIRQVLDADQRAYGQSAVEFERVIANARNLLVAESAYHRAVVDRAIALARLEQAIGTRLPQPVPAAPAPTSTATPEDSPSGDPSSTDLPAPGSATTD